MRRIGRVAYSREWLEAQGALRKLGDDPRSDAEVRRLWNQARALLVVQSDNGTDLQVDSTIRQFHAEYNNRALHMGLRKMPSSFNVVEAFLEYLPGLGIFRLRRQVDHAFSVPDFLDRLTLNELPITLEEASSYFEQGVIYTFENMVDPADLEFSIPGGVKVGVGGASIVRHGSEFSVLLLAGQEADLDAETDALLGAQTVAVAGKEGIHSAPEYERHAVPLPSRRPLWRTLALARFDLASATQQVGYVMHDIGDSYMTITDDPDCFLDQNGEFLDSSFEKTFKEVASRIRDYSIMFELCSTLLYLPAYFEKYGDAATERRYKTKFGDSIGDPTYDSMAKLCPPEERIAFRRATILTSTGQHAGSTSTQFRAPDFQIEKSGYWRRLTPGTTGADREGRPIIGRTWVEKQLTWVESVPPHEIDVARRSDRLDDGLPPDGRDPGWLYVARSAAHPRDVFKIGLTRRGTDQRARELSRPSSAIDGFFIMHEWPVSDCSDAEAKIHARLHSVRINPKREFFSLPLKEILAVVDEVISEQTGGSS